MGVELTNLPEGYAPAHRARFRVLCADLLGLEGGHADHAADRGGETNYGVSLRFLKANGQLDADRDGFADLDLNFDTVIDGRDIRAITPVLAYDLYERFFYIPPRFWSLPRPFDGALFDQAVNGGTTSAIKLLQTALNRCGAPSLRVDGQLGPLTRSKLDQALRGGRTVLAYYREAAAARYRRIVQLDPSQKVFLKGWLRRAERLGHV